MEVSFTRGKFICSCSFEERTVPKSAGFRWDGDRRQWFTTNHGTAARLHAYLDESAKREIAKVLIAVDSWTRPLSIPKGEELMPFQGEAALFALSRNRSYLALDPGLGKTPVAGVILQSLRDHSPMMGVYLCPPFLVRNTMEELNKWAPRTVSFSYPSKGEMTIFPDSLLTKEAVQDEIKRVAFCAREHKFGSILFVDEAHRYKNDDAKRTKALFGPTGLTRHFDRVVFLSGTPMPNRPIELYPVLSDSAPETINFMNKFEYASKYCSAFQNQFGWDFSGASNLDELATNVVGKFMFRCHKEKVLKELPPKTEEIIILDTVLPAKYVKLSKAILEKYSPEDLMKGVINANLGKDELHLATYRRELGNLKVEPSAEVVRYILDESDSSVLLFAIHREVIEGLTKALSKYDPLVITGDTRMESRHAYVKEFQSNPKRRLIIANLQAAGVGLTLTKATRVLLAEFSYVPADNDQAIDRTHRIGQTGNVLAQYLVFNNSVDRPVIETNLRKKKVTAHI